MTPRRSLRIANKLAAAGSNQAYADPPRLGKRKTRGSNDDESPRAKKRAPIKKAKSKKVQDQTKTPDLVNDEQQPVPPAPKDALASLPTEIQIQILSNVLNKSIAVRASDDEYVYKVISRLEPFLSINQKRKLWKEGRCRSQQIKSHRLLAPDVAPLGAQCVRQMTVGLIGRAVKHRQNVMRKLEEVLKNLSNLEVLDTTELSHNIAPMSQLRDLKHLSISTNECQCITPVSRDETLQSIILNSSSTLESLEVYPLKWDSSIHADREGQVPVRNQDVIDDGFSALKSLVLYGHSARPINGTDFQSNDGTYFSSIASKSLEKSFCSAERRDIQLRELTLDMHPELQGRDAYETEMDAMYRFIASFGTLTSLEIYDHNRFPHCRRNNPGLSEQLQEAIIVHSGLESLRLRYSETGEEVPFFSTPDIETFTKNLSELRVLEVMVRDNDIFGLVKAFSYTKDLESLTCGSPGTRDRRVDMGAIPFCEELMIAFLDLAKDNNEFVWEKTYRLKQLSVDHLHVEVGSDLKRHLTMLRTFNSDDRSVCIREKFGYLGPPLWEGSSEWASQIMKSV
ncbi:hypothetical protein FGSG_03010 [Fusarium graminearum PH-1]|uniref:hypothetical protein n=1 Tax=Gibberella zeae (strain ATCC MYA-4620 / CBS 123657 / FGSC 9075 / NRRL 31084 / PH-1) TaxID=229533 RepID=UPI000023F200|nr:hypothetical protein FGSG_03010 [Fusarium graminearum PH-1]ESU10280.1 hypothetical protein FGSG_03010 [Fusarium graminearum PH-1]|eukprot:XP_011322779.1 hypothetical protein FGSG_03010 [Fusarium graminearum PH-1]